MRDEEGDQRDGLPHELQAAASLPPTQGLPPSQMLSDFYIPFLPQQSMADTLKSFPRTQLRTRKPVTLRKLFPYILIALSRPFGLRQSSHLAPEIDAIPHSLPADPQVSGVFIDASLSGTTDTAVKQSHITTNRLHCSICEHRSIVQHRIRSESTRLHLPQRNRRV